MNGHGVAAIYRFEMARWGRTLWQSLITPVITTALYFVVFGSALGSRMTAMEGVSYGAFIVPGLTLLAVFMIAALFLSSGSIIPIYFIAGWITPTKPRELDYYAPEDKQFWQGVRASPARTARDIRSRFRDLDRRLADIESYVTSENRSLAREIEQLR